MGTTLTTDEKNAFVETVDEFTQGEDAPKDYREFRKYVREMADNYRTSGMNVYRSSRSTQAWAQR